MFSSGKRTCNWMGSETKSLVPLKLSVLKRKGSSLVEVVKVSRGAAGFDSVLVTAFARIGSGLL